ASAALYSRNALRWEKLQPLLFARCFFLNRVRSRIPFNSSRAIPRWVSVAFRSESLAEDVIRVPAEAGFLARQVPELAANGLRALALRFALRRRRRQSPALFVVLLADALQLRAARLVAVRIGGAVLDAEVDADEIGRGPRRSLGQIHGHEQKPFAVLAPE